MSRDDKAWQRKMRRERRDAEIVAKIDRKYRELQREVHSEIRREIRNELRHELRHEIRREFEQMERRLGGRIDAASRRRLETSRAGRGLPEYGGRLSQRAIMTDSEWVARLRMTRRDALAAAAGGLVLASRGESFGTLEPGGPEPPANPRVWTRFEFE